MSTGVVLDDRSRRALERARAEGMETFEDVCRKMGWEVPEPPPPPEPHWSSVKPLSPEPPQKNAARKLWRAGFYVLSWIDYFGEFFAYELGITSPKYQYVIDELISIQEEVDAEAEAEREATEEATRIESEEAAAEEEGRPLDDAVDSENADFPVEEDDCEDEDIGLGSRLRATELERDASDG